MKTENKKLITLLIVLVVLILAAFIIAFIIKNKKENEVPYTPITSSSEANDVDSGITSSEPMTETLVADETVGIQIEEEYVYRVSIDNMGELADTGIIPEALDYVEPYLDQYFEYYLGTEDRYSAVYIPNTDKYTSDMYEFVVYVEALDLEINCVYVASEKYYFLRSRFNPNGE